MYYDDDFADDGLFPVREEPHCGGCCDSGRAPARWWAYFGRGYRPCPDCANGDLFDRVGWWLWWRHHQVVDTLSNRWWARPDTRPAPADTGAPF